MTTPTCSFDYTAKKYVPDTNITYYDINSFKDQYRYTIDWLNSRAAWLSEQYAPAYKGTITPPSTTLYLGDADLDGTVNVKDATVIQKAVAKTVTLSADAGLCADVDGNEKVTVKDATAVQKFVAKVETGYKIGEAI